MSTTNDNGTVAPMGVPPAQFQISATPDGKYLIMQIGIFFELGNAVTLAEGMATLAKQLQLGLYLPGGSIQRPPQ